MVIEYELNNDEEKISDELPIITNDQMKEWCCSKWIYSTEDEVF